MEFVTTPKYQNNLYQIMNLKLVLAFAFAAIFATSVIMPTVPAMAALSITCPTGQTFNPATGLCETPSSPPPVTTPPGESNDGDDNHEEHHNHNHHSHEQKHHHEDSDE